MKTARFATIVQSSGKPETHLLLVKPAQDRALQAAVKAHRVMTIFQGNVGTKADRGKVGFEPGAHRQFLVFPKSLKRFAGTAVVGIKYELLEKPVMPKKDRAVPHTPAKIKARLHRQKPTRPAPGASSKVIPFHPAPKKEADSKEVAHLKTQVKRAMDALEQGKQVAAFNLLKRIAE